VEIDKAGEPGIAAIAPIAAQRWEGCA